jgi:phosphoribulokinase
MSRKYPIVAVTGSSGAGTSAVHATFEALLEAESINAAYVEGDSFHKYERDEMRKLTDEWERTAGRAISHFGPEANLFEELEALFREYGEQGTGTTRLYLHNEERAARYGQKAGTFTPWQQLPDDTELLVYEGLHGGVVTDAVDIAQHVDLLIGVTPIINLEWIQKIQRDLRERGHSLDMITDTILRRMPDYVHYITPQFSRTHVNFQRVPMIRFATPEGVDLDAIRQQIAGAFRSRPDTLVVPGDEIDLAMRLILESRIRELVEEGRRLRAPSV